MANPLAIILISLAVTAIWTIVLSFILGSYYEMDHPKASDDLARELAPGRTYDGQVVCSQQRYSFFSTLAIYRQCYFGIFVGSIVVLLFAMELNRPSAAGALSISAVYSVAFLIWMNFCYEGYQHNRYHINGRCTYTGRAYAFTIALGSMALIMFMLGLFWMVT